MQISSKNKFLYLPSTNQFIEQVARPDEVKRAAGTAKENKQRGPRIFNRLFPKYYKGLKKQRISYNYSSVDDPNSQEHVLDGNSSDVGVLLEVDVEQGVGKSLLVLAGPRQHVRKVVNHLSGLYESVREIVRSGTRPVLEPISRGRNTPVVIQHDVLLVGLATYPVLLAANAIDLDRLEELELLVERHNSQILHPAFFLGVVVEVGGVYDTQERGHPLVNRRLDVFVQVGEGV